MPRVISAGPMPPEKLAYALARYSRSPDSIRESVQWVRAHDSSKFLESFYFQYGHASIADLGHLALSFEGVSELAAIEIEDEPLWDGQARSSRYQDFARGGFITPPEAEGEAAGIYAGAAQALLDAYRRVHARMAAHLKEKLPRPESMRPDAYERNIQARAFDVARYLLFLGVPTGVGQVTSIRTLERQIRRWRASEYAELRQIGDEAAAACARPPDVQWTENAAPEPLAPTLAKYVDADPYPAAAMHAVAEWARQNLGAWNGAEEGPVRLTRIDEPVAGIAATLLYAVTDRPFETLYETTRSWSRARQMEVLEAALGPRGRRDELLRAFRTAPYAFDLRIDIGAYRDLHRHRRCHQTRQAWSWRHGCETPEPVREAGLEAEYLAALQAAQQAAARLPEKASHYLLPFAARGRFLFQMDFAEAEYIIRLRSGVKGHFSYRRAAWEMKREMERVEPELGRLIEATPPWIEDPLVR
ncbi:MAG: FAD-dependent thymidylate synthase [Bryobacteraceae bacterium]|nr:FAD-dependent thymidylate synthase [Bryobacteraceae bacterium]